MAFVNGKKMSIGRPAVPVAKGLVRRGVPFPSQGRYSIQPIWNHPINLPTFRLGTRGFRGFGDFGFSVGRVLSAPVRAVSSAVSTVTSPVTNVVRSVVSPVISAGQAITQPVVRTVMNVGQSAGQAVLKAGSKVNPMVRAAAVFNPFTAIPAATSLAVDYTRARRSIQQANDAIAAGGGMVPDGPFVTVYSADGSQAQIPENYLSNGKYMEAGTTWSIEPPKMVTIYSAYGDQAEVPESLVTMGKYTDAEGYTWSIVPPANENASVGERVAAAMIPAEEPSGLSPAAPAEMQPAQEVRMATVYAADGSVGQVEENLIVNGQYTEDGVLWTTAPQAVSEDGSQTWWQKIVTALRASNERYGLSGIGEDISMAPGADLSSVWDNPENQAAMKALSAQAPGGDTASMLDRLASTVTRVKATATSARRVVQAVKGKKSAPAAAGGAGGADRGDSSSSIMGLPTPVVIGAGVVLLGGATYLVVKKMSAKRG